MSFRQDLQVVAGLEDAYQPGLKALRSRDREKITDPKPRNLTGSADIDTALCERYPDSPRWDYVAASTTQNRSEFLHWIEVHPADGEGTIGEVQTKLAWLKEWLFADGKPLNNYPRRFVWIASGRSAFQQNSPQLKKLASQGLVFAGGFYSMAEIG